MPPGPKTTLILQRYTLVSDGMGGSTLTYQGRRKVKGVLYPLHGNERFITGKTEVYRTHKFLMDYPIGITITPIDKFALGARKFDIKVVVDPLETHRNLEIDLLEVT